MWCVCVIAVLLVSTTGRSEIVTDSDWSSDYDGGSVIGNSGISFAYAESDGDGVCWAGGEGWESATTTEDEDLLDYSGYCSGYVYAGAWWEATEYCCAEAWSIASVELPWTTADSVDLNAVVSGTRDDGYWLEDSDSGGDGFFSGSTWFDAYESIESDQTAVVGVTTPLNSDSSTEAIAEARAWVTLTFP